MYPPWGFIPPSLSPLNVLARPAARSGGTRLRRNPTVAETNMQEGEPEIEPHSCVYSQ